MHPSFRYQTKIMQDPFWFCLFFFFYFGFSTLLSKANKLFCKNKIKHL